MAYSLSDRHNHSSHGPNDSGGHGSYYDDDDHLHLGVLASICVMAGLVCLLTAWLFTFETERIFSTNTKPLKNGVFTEAGPINVRKYNESYHIELETYVDEMQWSFIEGEVLNKSKESLFSFGEELWHETGYDEGHWRETNHDYKMDVTFPNPGVYYIRFSSESSKTPKNVKIKVTKRLGSSVPHFWFGIILIALGILLNEIRNRTISRTIASMLEE